MDHQTKGDEPFQELVSVQLLDQPARPEATSPLRGRKSLIFSDGRQAASRLSGKLKDFSLRDSIRPLLLPGSGSSKRGSASRLLSATPIRRSCSPAPIST